MQTVKHILALLVLFGIFSSCNFSNEEDCGGDGGIQVNQELYNEISVAVGETFSVDLIGDPPVFSHPNNVPIIVVQVNGGDQSIAEITIVRENGERGLISIVGKSPGSLSLSIEAVDDCAGEKNIAVKNIELMVME